MTPTRSLASRSRSRDSSAPGATWRCRRCSSSSGSRSTPPGARSGRKHAFDPYPFILLNLLFSTQAAYAAPLILLAQNRQADRDKEEVERDRETNARSLAETEFLARELADVRLTLEQKADREDLIAPLEQLTQAIERLQGRRS